MEIGNTTESVIKKLITVNLMYETTVGRHPILIVWQ